MIPHPNDKVSDLKSLGVKILILLSGALFTLATSLAFNFIGDLLENE